MTDRLPPHDFVEDYLSTPDEDKEITEVLSPGDSRKSSESGESGDAQAAEEEFSHELKIPRDRVAVLIGKDGTIKRALERDTGCKIDVDSKEGEVFIFGTDGLELFVAKNIVTAIARGFNPQVARQLLKPDFSFEMLLLTEFCKKDHLKRVKGRIIGREGKSRQFIEEYTQCSVCIYGKTVGIIGRVEYVDAAKRACVMLLEGSPHTSVFKWLERKRREMKLAEIRGDGTKASE